MTYSAAQQHLLQRLGIIQLQLSMQPDGVDFAISLAPHNAEHSDSTEIPTLDWQPMPASGLRDDLHRALAMFANNHQTTEVWVHSDCPTPLLMDQQLYLPTQLDATSKRELWHSLCQQAPSV